MIASGIALFMSTSIDSSYSSASEQTFAATSCDIFQVVRSEEPPTVPTKMELRCDGFEVVRTKHKTGFDECLKKLDEAREKLKKMESSKSTGLTYDSYALAHEREKERRKKDRMTRYKREKDHRMELKIQHYQNKLDDIKETSPGHNDARELLSNKMSRCKDKMNDISPMVSSSLSSENYVGKSRNEAHIQKQTKKKQRNEDHALSIKSASVENNVKEQKIEETWPILSVISHKEALSFYGSYYTTESASTSSKSFRLRRMPRENLKQKALELLANSSNNSSYSETTIEYEEVGKPATNSSLYDSNSSSNEKIAFMDMPKVDIIQRPPSENLCKAELVTDNFSEDVEEESLTTEVFT